jgi:predicted TIM-barrel fold metal-dependent hydrolase
MTNASTSPPGSGPCRLVDVHVHVVGNGRNGSGCWLKADGWRGPLSAFLARSAGLPVAALKGDLEELYAERLLRCVRESSLDAVVVLAQEEAYAEDGRKLAGVGLFHVPNDYVLGLARRHPEFLPGVSIHPGRPDALEELEKCLAGGAALMKCLPNCQNIDCANPRYTRFWERMAEAGLPLLVHTGAEFTLPVVNARLADPTLLARPLACGVTVIAAHCGTRSLLWDPQYFPVFAEMTRRFPRLYGDTSAFLVPANRCRGSVLTRCLETPLRERLVHGSDYPVPSWGFWVWARGCLSWRTWRRWQRHPNPLERDYQLKRAAGFPEEVFTRAPGMLRLARNGPP